MEPNWQRNPFPHQQRTVGIPPRFFPTHNAMPPTPQFNIIQQPMNAFSQINSLDFTNAPPQGTGRSFSTPTRPNAPQFESKPHEIVDNFLKSIKFKKGQPAIETKATSMGNSFLQVCYV